MATLNGFYGKPYKKAARRKNRPGGSPRKLYPYVRKDQKGTGMENFVHSNYDKLIEQGNAVKLTNERRMKHTQARGGLAKDWGGTYRALQGMNSIRSYIKNNGGTAANARKMMVGISETSFGADPKSR